MKVVRNDGYRNDTASKSVCFPVKIGLGAPGGHDARLQGPTHRLPTHPPHPVRKCSSQKYFNGMKECIGNICIGIVEHVIVKRA